MGRPVDRDEWLTTPQTVNAFYNPRFNEVVFPAAALRPPLFDPEADDAANYGGIGATIGHEIGHGFDDQGSKYDGEGNLPDWWEPIALKAYLLAQAEAGVDEPPVLDGLTGPQRVFFAWAQTWRAVTREEEAIRRLAIDPHAPPDLRCNAVVTNIDAFHDAFGLTETDALFAPEAERVRIW